MASPENATNNWRKAEDIEQFGACFNLSDEAKQQFSLATQLFLTNRLSENSLGPKLLKLMRQFFLGLHQIEAICNDPMDLDFLKPDGTEGDEDMLMNIYIDCVKRINSLFPDDEHAEALIQVLGQHVPNAPVSIDQELYCASYIRAFERAEAIKQGRPKISKEVFKRISECFTQYDPERHQSPYTSIVGPAGIGKSFCVRSIARNGDAYVVYANLGKKALDMWPQRSNFGDWLLGGGNIDWFISDWLAESATRYDCFIASHIIQVQICREKNINPLEFFDMHVNTFDKKYARFQKMAYKALQDLYADVFTMYDPFGPGEKAEAFDYRKLVDECLPAYKQRIMPLFDELQWKCRGSQRQSKSAKCAAPSLDKPSIIFCFDEASELLEEVTGPAFVSLRRAMRHRKARNSKLEDSFFGVIVDRSVRDNITTFPSIFEINSFDILSEEPCASKELTSTVDYDSLYSFGRPSWAALWMMSTTLTLGNAQFKLYGGNVKITDTALTAMLSVRLPLDIQGQSLQKTLVANHLRMIYDIISENNLIRSIQPPEPILALVSREQMRAKEFKCSMLQNLLNLYKNSIIDIENVKQMVSSLILLFSFDQNGERIGEDDAQKLSDFMGSLFGTNQTKEWEIHPHITHLWRDGYVFFNQFTTLDSDLTDEVLRHAWARGVAFLAHTGTAHFDILIPVAVPVRNKMTYILIQTKNCADDSLDSPYLGDGALSATQVVEDSESIPKAGEPFIFIVMALRHEGRPGVKFHVGSKSLTLLAVGMNKEIYPHVVNVSEENVNVDEVFKLLQDLLDGGHQSGYHKILTL